MSPKTKAFFKELSDLLCKYDAEIAVMSVYECYAVADFYIDNKAVLEDISGEITWARIDRILEKVEEAQQ